MASMFRLIKPPQNTFEREIITSFIQNQQGKIQSKYIYPLRQCPDIKILPNSIRYFNNPSRCRCCRGLGLSLSTRSLCLLRALARLTPITAPLGTSNGPVSDRYLGVSVNALIV